MPLNHNEKPKSVFANAGLSMVGKGYNAEQSPVRRGMEPMQIQGQGQGQGQGGGFPAHHIGSGGESVVPDNFREIFSTLKFTK